VKQISLQSWKDTNKGKRCFVVGNGPSLLRQDLSRLKDEVVIGCNAAYKIAPIDYLCVADMHRATALKAEIHRLSEADPNVRMLFGNRCLDAPRQHPRVDTPLYPHLDSRAGYIDLGKGTVSNGHTIVLDLGIPLAEYIGSKEIFLLGCDCTSNVRFYEVLKEKGANPWPFIFRAYIKAVHVLAARGVRLYNATCGGKLSTVQRVSYADALKGCAPPLELPPLLPWNGADFAGVHKGKRCFIVGNGPSTKKLDFAKLSGEITIACDRVIFGRGGKWLPTYYMCVDDKVIRKNSNGIERCQGPIKLFPREYVISQDRCITGDHKVYVLEVLPERRKSNLLKAKLNAGPDTLVSMVRWARFLGCKPIYVLGGDCSKPQYRSWYRGASKYKMADWSSVLGALKAEPKGSVIDVTSGHPLVGLPKVSKLSKLL